MVRKVKKNHKRWRFKGKILIIPAVILACILSILYFSSRQNITVAFPQQGESAVGTSNSGVISSSLDQNPIPIASLTKIMTAYLVLKAYPLKSGEDGPTLTVTAKDVSVYLNDKAAGDSVMAVAQGEKMNEKQLLEGLLLPSADNIADLLGQWVSGSDAAFVAEMNKTAQSLGMTQTNYADSTETVHYQRK